MQELPTGILIALSDIVGVHQALQALVGVLCASKDIKFVEAGNILAPINSRLSDAVRRINEERQEK
jgi:hypothetical protein